VKSCYDNETGLAAPPATDAVLIYIAGGNAAHGWTDAEISEQTARYRVPCFVRSVAPFDAQADAELVLGWLSAHGAPKGIAIMWDLEGAQQPAYITAVGDVMHENGYLVLPYGERSTLFVNPALDGFWDADPSGSAHISAGCVATQWLWADGYDLSWIEDTVPLWDTQAPAKEDDVIGLSQLDDQRAEVRLWYWNFLNRVPESVQVRDWWVSRITDPTVGLDLALAAFLATAEAQTDEQHQLAAIAWLDTQAAKPAAVSASAASGGSG